jgi:hypothetical protein
MATVYKIKIKTVSAFVNCNEKDMTEIIEKLLKDYKDKKTGLGFEAIEIDVERLT